MFEKKILCPEGKGESLFLRMKYEQRNLRKKRWRELLLLKSLPLQVIPHEFDMAPKHSSGKHVNMGVVSRFADFLRWMGIMKVKTQENLIFLLEKILIAKQEETPLPEVN